MNILPFLRKVFYIFHIVKLETQFRLQLSPSLDRKNPGGVDLDSNNFSPSPFSALLPRKGGVEESLITVTPLTDGSTDKLPVNFLILAKFYHPDYLPVLAVDVEISSLVIQY